LEELPFKTIALSTYAGNLAAGKPTAQSSTYPGGQSGKAVDGNPDTEFNNGHCSHTKLDPSSSWWSVDLGSDNVLVYEVRIVNRFSQYNSIRQRSRNYIITLGEYFISSIFFWQIINMGLLQRQTLYSALPVIGPLLMGY